MAKSAGRSRNEFLALGTQAQLQAHETDPFISFRVAQLPRGRYLVTGCAGFIGSHLTEALTQRGCGVVGVDCFTDSYERAIKERNLRAATLTGPIEFHEADLAETPLEPLLDGVDGSHGPLAADRATDARAASEQPAIHITSSIRPPIARRSTEPRLRARHALGLPLIAEKHHLLGRIRPNFA